MGTILPDRYRKWRVLYARIEGTVGAYRGDGPVAAGRRPREPPPTGGVAWRLRWVCRLSRES
jgi:hypothetical protein